MTLIKEDAIQKKLTMNANNKRYYSEEYIKGWEDGVRDQYNATMPTNANWIPCSERLPAKRRSVLITTSEGFVGEACYWETTENHVIWKGYRWNATYWDDEVLAWMPLPKPYKGAVK